MGAQEIYDRLSKVNPEQLENTVNSIQASDIKAYIDLEDYGVGEHEVTVKVTGNDLKLNYSSKTKKVKVKITKE